uniref:Leucine-rich repeat-containing protein 1 n=1 Tax=Schistocephalus solidus TaxID=70667 RepID=A0A0V0J6Y6_SCHSO
MFKCLPFIKGCGTHLESFDKQHSSLSSVPDDVLRNSKTLEECRLDANQIKDLPNSLFRLEKLRVFSISDNELTKIPPLIGNFIDLVELDISRNDINELPTSIRFCKSLQKLDISNNPLNSLPDGFSQLENLRELNLNDVSLFQLPQDFGALTKLRKLELRENCLNSLPRSFAQLSSLEFLDLGGNEFASVPSYVGALQSLVEFWLDDNQLTSLPDEIGSLQSLQQWDVSENQLTALPRTISGLTSLVDLNLTQNYLDCLPDEIGELRKLALLKLNRNQLVDLTPAIGSCESLQEVYLTENYLSTLPSSIGQLRKMIHFNVDKNQLCELPSAIGDCVSLNILSLRDNNLHRLPADIGNCRMLRVIDVSGNRLDRLPVTLTACPLTALWLAQNQAQPIVSLQRAVDEVSGEEFLTCYLLPQEGNEDDDDTASVLRYNESTEPVPRSPTDVGASVSPKKPCENGGSLAVLGSGDDSLMPSPVKTAGGAVLVNGSSSNVDVGGGFGSASPHQSPGNLRANGTGEAESRGDMFLPSPRHPPSSNDSLDPSSGLVNRVRFTPSVSSRDGHSTDSQMVPRDYPKTRHPIHTRKLIDTSGTTSKKDSDATSPPTRKAPTSAPTLPSSALGLDDAGHQEMENGMPPPKSAISDSSYRSSSDDKCDMYTPLVVDKQHQPPSILTSYSESPPNRPKTLKTLSFPDTGTNAHSNQREFPGCYEESGTSSGLISSSSTTSGVDGVFEANLGIANDVESFDNGPTGLQHPTRGDGGGGRGPKKPGVSFAPADQDDAENEEAVYSSGAEELDTIAKSVAFSEEVVDNEASSNLKLIRRDTPHYTKRARIHSKNTDGVNNEEVVLKLLKKYHDPTAADAYADPNAPERVKTANALLMVAAAAAAAASGEKQSGAESTATTHQVTMHITLERAPGGGLGLSIAGGVGSVPFRGLDQGIFVSRLSPGGLAENCGLKVGDKLLEVNGVSLVNVEHHVAVCALRSDCTKFNLLVSREVLLPKPSPAPSAADAVEPRQQQQQARPFNLQVDSSVSGKRLNAPSNLSSSLLTTTFVGRSIPNATTGGTNLAVLTGATAVQTIKCVLRRDWSGLGFSIAGGRGLLVQKADTPNIYISRIVEGGAAAKSGNLRVGDQLIKINGIDVRSARHDQVITLLTGSAPQVELELLRPIVSSPSLSPSSPLSPAPEQTVSGCPDMGPVLLRYEEGLPVERVVIPCQQGQPLGFSVCGGKDVSCFPFSSTSSGIFVSHITDGGVAKQTGLRVGDRILRVNEQDIRDASHDEAVQALIAHHENITLEIRRDLPPSGLRELNIPCHPSDKIGLKLLTFQSPVNEDLRRFSLDGIYVSCVVPGGAVARDGRLRPGDQLLEANSVWLLGLGLPDVAKVMHASDGNLRLTVCDGVDPSTFVQKATELFRLASLQTSTITSSLTPVQPCNLIDLDCPIEERVKPLQHDVTERTRAAAVTADRCIGFRQLTTLEVVAAADCSTVCTVSLLSPHTNSDAQIPRASPQRLSTISSPRSTASSLSASYEGYQPACARRQPALQSQLMAAPLVEGTTSPVSQPAHAVVLSKVEGCLEGGDSGELSALGSYLPPSRGDISLCRLKYLPSARMERISSANLPSLVQESQLVSARRTGSGGRKTDPPSLPSNSSPVEFELTSDKLIHYCVSIPRRTMFAFSGRVCSPSSSCPNNTCQPSLNGVDALCGCFCFAFMFFLYPGWRFAFA